MFNFIRHSHCASKSLYDFHSHQQHIRVSMLHIVTNIWYCQLPTVISSTASTIAIRPWSHSLCFRAYGPASTKILQESRDCEDSDPPLCWVSLIPSLLWVLEISTSPCTWLLHPSLPSTYWLLPSFQGDEPIGEAPPLHWPETKTLTPPSLFPRCYSSDHCHQRGLYPYLYLSSVSVSLRLHQAMSVYINLLTLYVPRTRCRRKYCKLVLMVIFW